MRSTLPISHATPEPPGLSARGFFDGSCPKNPGPMGIGYAWSILPSSPEDKPNDFEQGYRLGDGTNNRAEYLALIALLRDALRSGVTEIDLFTDSRVIMGHLTLGWKVTPSLKHFNAEAAGLLRLYTRWSLTHIDRESNTDADYLSKHPTDPSLPPPEIEIDITRAIQRKLSRRQAAMVRWWWKTHRCRSERLLARLFGTPGSFSQYRRIGEGKAYADLCEGDLALEIPSIARVEPPTLNGHPLLWEPNLSEITA